jgi:Family of unknown function (DUF6516)
MDAESDPDSSFLLDLDGESFAASGRGDYVVKFAVKRVPPSPERPHGLKYSLTLHDASGSRLVGFDNAHAAPVRKGQASRVMMDHRHRMQTIRPYGYRDAVTLLEDFWAEVNSVLKERGE